MPNLNRGRTTLILFIITATIWYALSRYLPDGHWRDTLIIGFTFLFCGVFLWSLFTTLKRIYGNSGHLWKELILASFNVFIFLLAFAGVYSEIGIVDTTRDGSPITHDFWLTSYYSIITFTSTGYGDFQPQGIGRVLASLHALVGYFRLGLMASTGLTVIQWRAEGSGVNRGADQ
ncbi:ion channel [Psychrobacter sp. FDAARGOS_221]|uniref:ion channel n=1 Tax=Psychrobacter sp. FDAARGOS_221 TaxID=1975705 RepID=UPI000BB57DA0|nr:ion channel [Psychrobacter sp. FDAARGOS_221]PNK61071.1 hypothetical protein A6J60_009425 [Psychrobacter sp. FDAARGOS_221]